MVVCACVCSGAWIHGCFVCSSAHISLITAGNESGHDLLACGWMTGAAQTPVSV